MKIEEKIKILYNLFKVISLKLEELNCIDDEGRIQVSLKGVKDWPSNLDTENFEIDIISNGDDKDGEGYIAGWAGGDWQDLQL